MVPLLDTTLSVDAERVGEREILGVTEEDVSLAEGDDRRAVGVVVGLEQRRRVTQNNRAEADEAHYRHQCFGLTPRGATRGVNDGRVVAGNARVLFG